MESNFFQGPIFSSLSHVRGLQKLDLSSNNLSGQIPEFLESFTLSNMKSLIIPMQFQSLGAVSSVGVFEDCICKLVPSKPHMQECVTIKYSSNRLEQKV